LLESANLCALEGIPYSIDPTRVSKESKALPTIGVSTVMASCCHSRKKAVRLEPFVTWKEGAPQYD